MLIIIFIPTQQNYPCNVAFHVVGCGNYYFFMWQMKLLCHKHMSFGILSRNMEMGSSMQQHIIHTQMIDEKIIFILFTFGVKDFFI
jgi:hypothetical protein